MRPATISQNRKNQSLRSNNTSGLKGVSWTERLKKWRAQIQVNGKHYELGYYKTKVKAAQAYDKAAIKLHGKFARINGVK